MVVVYVPAAWAGGSPGGGAAGAGTLPNSVSAGGATASLPTSIATAAPSEQPSPTAAASPSDGAAEVAAVRSSDAAGETTSSDSARRSFVFHYDVEIVPPAGGESLEAWIPVPTTTRAQSVVDIDINANVLHQIHTEPIYGNRMIHLRSTRGVPDPIMVNMTFKARRSPYTGEPAASVKQVDIATQRKGPVDTEIAELTDRVVAGIDNDEDRARAIYNYVSGNVTVDQSRLTAASGDAVRANSEKRGGCFDLDALLVAMARSAQIPARYGLGFELPSARRAGEIYGYDCWAELYLKGKGWVPVDAAGASRSPSRRDEYFGRLDENRIAFSRGRDLTLAPPQQAGPVGGLLYPYVEVDGRPLDDPDLVRTKVAFEDVGDAGASTQRASQSNSAAAAGGSDAGSQ